VTIYNPRGSAAARLARTHAADQRAHDIMPVIQELRAAGAITLITAGSSLKLLPRLELSPDLSPRDQR
jgi:hypothetical protein